MYPKLQSLHSQLIRKIRFNKKINGTKLGVIFMALKLMYITNNEYVARIAEKSGVDIIFIDLEINGKHQRQGHLDTVISKHSISDISKVKSVLSKAKLLVRINPIYENSEKEIKDVISNGAEIVMLPFFSTAKEVESFIRFVDGKALTCLLVETPSAVKNIDEILAVDGIDMIHIGLNDLHLGYGLDFMFELLTNGVVEMLCNKFQQKGITYGFGGIAQIGQGMLPAEYIIAEHYRLGSNMAILARSFCNPSVEIDICKIGDTFRNGIKKIRSLESELSKKEVFFFEKNYRIVTEKVMLIKERLANKKEGSL
jgi:2-keto-3-deoxy-L-rhamnonate aldolase RhmA